MYPSEMPYFNLENPVVRDELWHTYYIEDFKQEIEIEIDFEVDAKKLTDAEFDELFEKLEELGHCVEDFYEKADFSINYIWRDDEEYATSFEIRGWCYESIYEKVIDCLDDYNVSYIRV